jgi:serine-type D-Ala-D-Ala carboxypeptidase/endopeptidase (penicillin-binding protein 4)
VAVAVRDELGRSILDVRSDLRLLPASTMKTVTAATVLEVLGPRHRFATTVAATAPLEDGVIRGDLVLVGGGDPVLASDDYHRYVYPSRPWTSLTELADAVVGAGVTEVTGGLVADASAWGPSTLAAGWPAHYLSDQDARHVSALTVDAGLRVVVGSTPEEPLTVELTPVTDPGRRAGDRLAALLAQRGVVIRGHVTASTFPVPTAARIAAVRSPTVAELLTFTIQRSDNHLADSLLRAAAHAATGDGSWAAAHRTAMTSLAELGVDPTGLHVADGSGLSRLDRVTAGQLVDLDVTMTSGTAGEPWVASLAVAGETGTLKNRLRGTPGHGRFRGKTGTLDDVKAVVGHVTGPEGRRMHLAVMGNGVPAGGQWAITVLMDTLQLALVDHLDGCRQEAGEDGTPRRVCDAA